MKTERLSTQAIALIVLILTFYGGSMSYGADKIAEVFGEAIYLNDLDPDEKELERYKGFYPNLTEVEVVNEIRTNVLSSLILVRVFNQFSENYDVEPTQEEIEDFSNSMANLSPDLVKDEETFDLSETEQQELTKQISNMHRDFVRTYKISKKLYELYGGTVIFQQGNPFEPVGAYRKLLEMHETKEDFVIYDKEFRASFWDYYVREHLAIPEEKVDYTIPWWKSEPGK